MAADGEVAKALQLANALSFVLFVSVNLQHWGPNGLCEALGLADGTDISTDKVVTLIKQTCLHSKQIII